MNSLRIAGFSVRAPDPVQAEPAARALIAALPGLRPQQGREALAARLAGRGAVLRWRAHRAALLAEVAGLGAALGVDGPLHLKIYEPKNALETAIGTVTPARGATSWRSGLALRDAGIPTPEPLLLLLRKPARIHRETVLVTRALVDPVLLTEELKARLASGRPTRPLLDEAAALAARLHDAGFLHGDFTASNLVLAGPPDDRRLVLIDLDRTKRLSVLPAPLRRRLQVLDLRLLLLTSWAEVPRRAWLRLLARYARARGLGSRARRRLAARVLSARRGRVRVGAAAPTLGGPTPWPDPP